VFNLWRGRTLRLRPPVHRLLFQALFLHLRHPISRSVGCNYRLIQPCSPLHSIEFRVYSVGADKESYLSLIGRTFTFINQVVQLRFIILVGAVIYGLNTEIHTQRIALNFELKN